jgi:hypothetical protein
MGPCGAGIGGTAHLGQPLHVLPDMEHATFEVDVVPTEGERAARPSVAPEQHSCWRSSRSERIPRDAVVVECLDRCLSATSPSKINNALNRPLIHI